MSVQLILYPQAYNGLYNSYSVPYFNEYLANAKFNFGFVFNPATNPYPLANFYANNPINRLDAFTHGNMSWSSWHTNGHTFPLTLFVFGSVPAPTISGGICTLHSTSSGTNGFDTGIYQRVQNLTAGASYNLKIQILEFTSGELIIGHHTNWNYSFIGSAGVHPCILNNTITPTVGTQTLTFTATASTEMLVLRYKNSVAHDLVLGEVSIKENITSAPLTDAYTDGQVILDLYEESNLPLSLSVDNFKNVAEKSQSYSKAFKLPSTKRNNKIFSNLFDVTRSIKSDAYAFNPYKKTKAILKEDGYTVFDGYLRLIDITEKEQEVSYNVNLYSDTITLADTLKDKKIKHIDFTELSHDYDKINIKLSHDTNNGVVLETALPISSFAYKASLGTSKTDVIKYPFVKWDGLSYLSSGNVVLQNLEDAFRPFIKCKYLVDRIIAESGFTYSSDFLESTDFTKLYMDFNWGDNTPNVASISNDVAMSGASLPFAATSYTTIPIDIWYNCLCTTSNISQFDDTNNKFVSDVDNQKYDISYNIHLENTHSGSCSVTLRWVHKDSSGNELNEIDLTTQSLAAGSTSYNYIGSFSETLNSGDTLEVQFLSNTPNKVRLEDGLLSNMAITINISLVNLVNTGALTTLRGNLGQWEFLKGLLTMFNLMVLQDKDNPTNFIIEPYKAVFVDDSLSSYITHKTHDWTTKVDANEIKLTPLKLKKRVLLDFAEDSNDYATGLYKNATGYKYGSQEVDASSFNLLEGETKVDAKPFAATFIRPIFDGFTSEMTIPVIYTGKDDGSFEGYENKPRILYDNGKVTMSSNAYYIPAQNGESDEWQASFGQFSHLSEIPTTATTKDYNFKTGQLIGSIGNTPVDNLFNEYWSPYYDELYNPDTKEVKLKVYLSPSEISSFEFYDKVRIKNSLFRVNKIDYKPYEMSTVEFILIG